MVRVMACVITRNVIRDGIYNNKNGNLIMNNELVNNGDIIPRWRGDDGDGDDAGDGDNNRKTASFGFLCAWRAAASINKWRIFALRAQCGA